MGRKFVFVILLLFFCGFVVKGVKAQTDFENWKRQRRQKIQAFEKERNRKFHKFLKQRWKKMNLLKGEVEDTVPEPEVIPESTGKASTAPREIKTEEISLPSEKLEKTRERKKPQVITAPEKNKIKRNETKVTLNFFGQKIPFVFKSGWSRLTLAEVDREGIADFWKDFAPLPFESLDNQLTRARTALGLDDWGELLLVNRLTEKYYSKQNVARLVTWGILLKRGFRVRVGYSEDRIQLLYAARDRIYQLPFFDLDGHRFYVARFRESRAELGSLRTYQNSYGGVEKEFQFSLKQPAVSAAGIDTRQFSFEFQGKKYVFEVPVNRQAVEYFKTVPQLALGNYFRDLPAGGAETRLVEQLKSEVRGMNFKTSVRFLLNFVQNAFKYKTDPQQFGSENYLVPVETLHYPYSDCEDRALMFTWLVREILNRRVIGLDFPGHVAAAVEFPSTPPGFYFQVEKRFFVITDPTYINAGPGEIMPRYEDKQPGLLY